MHQLINVAQLPLLQKHDVSSKKKKNCGIPQLYMHDLRYELNLIFLNFQQTMTTLQSSKLILVLFLR